MDETKYYLWDIRGGWISRSAMVTSDIAQARSLTWPEALEMCKIYKASRGSLSLLPVPVELIREIAK
jgi:hypothetical protein